MADLTRRIEHGKTCTKAAHWKDGGYLHAENDDGPYDVDGVPYCGRCHFALGAMVELPKPRVQGFDRMFKKIGQILREEAVDE